MNDYVPSTSGYARPIKWLHWIIAVIVIGLVPVGISLGSLPRGVIQNTAYDLHRSFGAVVLALVAIRLATRLVCGVPPPELTLPRWQVRASTAVHWLLYALLFIVPLLGWAGTSAFGARITVFWLFTLPPLLEKDRDLSSILLGVHQIAALTLAAVFLLHIAAALHHRFVRHDGVMGRMT